LSEQPTEHVSQDTLESQLTNIAQKNMTVAKDFSKAGSFEIRRSPAQHCEGYFSHIGMEQEI